MNALNYEEILDENVICQILGYENPNVNDSIKGWHILMRTSLSEQEAELVAGKAENWEKIVNADDKFFIDVLGEEKAKTLYEDIAKMKLSFNI